MAKAKKSSRLKGLSIKKGPVKRINTESKPKSRVRRRIWPTIENGPTVQAKKTPLKGVVTSFEGIPIAGVEIGLKTTKQKTSISDECGNFLINIPDDYIGILVFGWAKNTASAEINLEELKKLKAIIISIKAITKYANNICKKNYKRSKRIFV